MKSAATADRRTWLTSGVAGIGAASFLSDAGHEIPTSLLPGFLSSSLGAPAAALGLIEGFADGLAGVAKLTGGVLANDPLRRRATAVGGYTTTAITSALIGLATAVWQIAVFRIAAWSARGLRVPSRNALLADAAPAESYGRAYGFERAMDNLGAIIGPLLAIVLVATVGLRTAILLSVIPGLLAVAAIIYAIRRLPRSAQRRHEAFRLRFREALSGGLRRVMLGIGAFELGNLAATLMILRATELLAPTRGVESATSVALWLYVGYNAAAALTSVPAGRAADRHSGTAVMIAGSSMFAIAYIGLAVTGPFAWLLALWFITAGAAIGCVETAENSTVAAAGPRLSAWFGLWSACGRSELWEPRGERHGRGALDAFLADRCVRICGRLDGRIRRRTGHRFPTLMSLLSSVGLS